MFEAKMVSSTAIALHACGYESKDKICKTARARAEVAARQAELRGARHVFVTSGVKHGSKWLADLIADNFKESLSKDFPPPSVHCLTNCFNSSTDTQMVLDNLLVRAEAPEHLVVVSSYWHCWILRPLYTYWAWAPRDGFTGQIEFVHPKPDPAGIKTVLAYAFYALVFRASLKLGFFRILDDWLNVKQSARQDSFPISGCG